MRRGRHLRPSGSRQAGLPGPLRPAAPRPGKRRHLHRRWRPTSTLHKAMGHVADIFTSAVLATLPGESRHRPHPLLHHRRHRAAQRPAVLGLLQQGPRGRRPQRQHHQRRRTARRTRPPRRHLPGLQRHRSDPAPGGALLRAHAAPAPCAMPCCSWKAPSRWSSWPRTASSWPATRTASARWPSAKWKSQAAASAYVFASETCAFDLIGAVYLHDVEPGEMVIVGPDGLTPRALRPRTATAPSASSSTSTSRAPIPSSSAARWRNRARTWAACWRANAPPMPTWWCPCPIPAWPPPSATPTNPACPTARRSSAITTWAAPSSNPRRPSAISESSSSSIPCATCWKASAWSWWTIPSCAAPPAARSCAWCARPARAKCTCASPARPPSRPASTVWIRPPAAS